MLTRRTFLAAATLAISQLLLASCRPPRNASQVRLLKGSVPAQILKEFQRQIEQATDLNFVQSEQLADLFQLLETWKKQATFPQPNPSGLSLPFKNRPVPVADLVTLGDFWFGSSHSAGIDSSA
ncbi:MAG: hypothetical protein HC781_09065 [Leptolyngbyaceae cyanobacterium CSU_1_4]|nr:hypothetical protein [Leptolyngbyaceae cyanobacterium CSU_1_4]